MPATTAPTYSPSCSHSHGLGDIAGHVVALTRIVGDGEVTREDIEVFDGAARYGAAVELAHSLRRRIVAGEIDATYAVVDTLYENGCRA